MLDSVFDEPLVSILTVTHNSRKDIDEWIASVCNTEYKNFEIVIVDNASTDGTAEYIEKTYPFVKLIKSKSNLGYSGGNALGVKFLKGKYVAVLNPDLVVDKYWLKELLNGVRLYPKAGIITSKVLLYGNPKVVNALGNEVHFTGFVFSRFLGESDNYNKPEYVLAPCGASFLIRRQIIDEIGFIDSSFFMEFGDIDLSLRVLLSGWKCLVMPSSRVYHKFTLKMSPMRFFILERGRFLTLFKNFDKKTLKMLLFPSLILSEVLTWGFALVKGKQYVVSKIKVYEWVYRHRRKILEYRLNLPKFKRVSDRQILQLATWKISLPAGWLNSHVYNVIIENLFNRLYSLLYNFTMKYV